MPMFIDKTDDSVTVLHGNSGALLAGPAFRTEAMPEPALFFLDGHYSGGDTALADDGEHSPLFKELAAIFSRGNAGDVIVVDDVRCFRGRRLTDPALGLAYATGFELATVLDKVCERWPSHIADVEGDMLRIHAPWLPTSFVF